MHQGNAAASLCCPVGGSTLVLMALLAQDCSEEFKAGIQSKFTHLRKVLEHFQSQTVARIEQEQGAALERVDKNWNLWKDRLDVLGQHRERAQSLLACPDHRTFLQVPLWHCALPFAWACTLLMTAESCSSHSHWELILSLAQGCDGALWKSCFWGSLKSFVGNAGMPLLPIGETW